MEQHVLNDVTNIMEGIIKENKFTASIYKKDTEYEIKEMTFIIISQIHKFKEKKMKRLINDTYFQLKKQFINNELQLDNDNGKVNNSVDKIYEGIDNIKTEDIIICKNDNKIKSKLKTNKSKLKEKKNLCEYPEFLKENNIKDYNYCFQIIENWEKMSEENKIEYLTEQVKYLANLPQPEQRSEEWYTFRKGMLTASDLYKAIGTEGIRRALIIKKCKPSQPLTSSGIGNACKHGIKYEDIAILIYEKMKKVKIFDYGCIQDKDFKIFGASPDGICGEGSGKLIGTMLEIKCPTSREIIEGEVPDMYWKQIQGQLEVCKLWNCDFLECKIIECNEEEFLTSNKEKGIVIDIINNETNKTEFIYAPLELFPNNYEKWLDNEYDKILENENITFLKVSYWYLEKFNCVNVKREPYWFYSHKPEIQKFWDEVLYYRENGCESLERKTKKRKKKQKYNYDNIDKCIIYSDSE
jgi:putative phage-type endonuclease